MNRRGKVERPRTILKRVLASTPSAATLVSAVAEAQGLELCTRPESDLDAVVLETDSAAEVARAAKAHQAPILVLSPKKLKEADRRQLYSAGARSVIDCESCILEFACCLADLLFESSVAQRLFAKNLAGAAIRLWPASASGSASDRDAWTGRLLGIRRAGAFVTSDRLCAEGTALELALPVADREAILRGRVAYAERGGFALEFALDHGEVAPVLKTFLGPEAVLGLAPSRAESAARPA